jgi:hypothetical protein
MLTELDWLFIFHLINAKLMSFGEQFAVVIALEQASTPTGKKAFDPSMRLGPAEY